MTGVSGDPAYVAAYGIAVTDSLMPFDDAYALTLLVLRHGGGPIPPLPKAHLGLPVLKRLTQAGYVQMEGVPDPHVIAYRRLSVDPDLRAVLNSVATTIEYEAAKTSTRRSRWLAAVTQDGLDLVAAHLPESDA